MRRLAAALVAVGALGLLAPAAQAAYVPVDSFGGPGRGSGQFGPPRPHFGAYRLLTSPAGIAFAGNQVIVADPLNHRVHRFTQDGRPLGSFGRKGVVPGRARMLAPEGLAVRAGNVFVAMNGNDRVDVFRGGRWRRMFYVRGRITRVFGFSRGAGRGQLHNPYGIASSSGGRFYVADLNNSRVNVYTAGGRSLGQLGGFGRGPGQFLAPYGVAVTPGGDVWVSDRELNRLQRFSATGALVSVVGSAGNGPGQFFSPGGLASDANGNVYVADLVNRRIQKLAPDGTFLEEFGQGVLLQPTYVAVDQACRVYVSDYRRVVVFLSSTGC